MKKTEENVIEAAIEALEFWCSGKMKRFPTAIGASLVRYAELLQKGVVSEAITKLDTRGHIAALEGMIEKKYCSSCGHKLEKQI